MRESRSPPSLQGEALADNSGGASLSFKEGERGVIDVHNVIIVPDVPIVLDVLIVLDVPNVHYVPDVHYYPYVLSVIYSLFQNFCSFNNHSLCNIKYYLQAVSTAV